MHSRQVYPWPNEANVEPEPRRTLSIKPLIQSKGRGSTINHLDLHCIKEQGLDCFIWFIRTINPASCGSDHWCHSQNRCRAILKRCKAVIPNPSSSLGLQTTSYVTLHLLHKHWFSTSPQKISLLTINSFDCPSRKADYNGDMHWNVWQHGLGQHGSPSQVHKSTLPFRNMIHGPSFFLRAPCLSIAIFADIIVLASHSLGATIHWQSKLYLYCLYNHVLCGLGILDLEKFGRALRLRWLWQDWTDESKPWTGSELPYNKDDRLLFNASTTITIGDGAKARFWHDNWLDGEAPKNLAPHLFELVARKNRSVQQELEKCQH